MWTAVISAGIPELREQLITDTVEWGAGRMVFPQHKVQFGWWGEVALPPLCP